MPRINKIFKRCGERIEMVNRIIIILLLLFPIVGCDTLKNKKEIVKVNVPIMYCPTPDRVALDRPTELYIDKIDPNTPDGDVVKYYKATVKQLQGYVNRLESVIDQYEKSSDYYKHMQKLDGDIKTSDMNRSK